MEHVIVWDGIEILSAIAFVIIIGILIIAWLILGGLNAFLSSWDRRKREKNIKEYEKKFGKDDNEKS